MNRKYCSLSITLLFFLISFCLNGNNKTYNSIQNFEALSPKEQVDTLANLCWQNREKNTELAIKYGMQGIDIAKEQNYNKKLGKLYNYIGVIYQHYKDNTTKAIAYYNEGLKISLNQKDSVEIAYVYNNLGDAFYKIGNVPLAKEYAEKSMEIFLRLGNDRGIAYSYINMGLVSRINKKYDDALAYFEKAISLRETLNDSIGIASANLEVAQTLYEMNQPDKAMPYFLKSLRMHQQLNNKNYIAYSMQGIGNIFLDRTELDSALVYFRNALALSKERNNPYGVINSQIGIAMVDANLGKEKEGQALLKSALSTAKQSMVTKNILDVYKACGEYYHLQGDFRKASENYQNYISIYDSLFSELQFQTLSEIKDRFQITEELNKINQNLKQKQKEQTYTVIIAILLVLIALILIYRYHSIAKLSSELKQLNETKDKIFSIISHDLISPFNVLIGMSDLLIEGLEKQQHDNALHNAKLIQETSTETYSLISNLLNWARTQRQRISLHKEKFDLEQLMHKVKSNLSIQSKKKNIEIKITANKPLIINADRNLISIVLMNLANNAIKFSRENGTIELSAKKDKGKIKVSVKDQGIGISKEKICLLLNQHKVDSTLGTTNEKGTGLGLLVCMEFIEMHNSKLQISSIEGKGSEFYFTITD